MAPVASSRVTAARPPAIAADAPETDGASDDRGARSVTQEAHRAQDERGNAPPDERGAAAVAGRAPGCHAAGTLRALWRSSRSTSAGSGTASLVEEREALRVKSLAGLGRHEDAQRAAAEFHARFPHSVFLSTFERMKETDR